MKRLFPFNTLFLCLFILNPFYPQNRLLGVQKKDKVLAILPGEPLTKQFVLSGSNKEMINFVINTAGRMALKAEWTGNAKTLIVILYKPGYDQVVRKEGKSPLIIEYNVSPDLISQNNTWRVSLAKFSSKTSAKGSISIFQEKTDKSESPALIDETTKIKNYQLTEEPEKELPETSAFNDTIRDDMKVQVESEEESPDRVEEETDLILAKTRIANLRKTSQVFKKLAEEPIPDSLNQQAELEAEEYNKWLLEKSEAMTALADEWEELFDKASGESAALHDFIEKFNQRYLEFQHDMQNENRQFTLISNIMKNKHDTAKNSINNIR